MRNSLVHMALTQSSLHFAFRQKTIALPERRTVTLEPEGVNDGTARFSASHEVDTHAKAELARSNASTLSRNGSVSAIKRRHEAASSHTDIHLQDSSSKATKSQRQLHVATSLVQMQRVRHPSRGLGTITMVRPGSRTITYDEGSTHTYHMHSIAKLKPVSPDEDVGSVSCSGTLGAALWLKHSKNKSSSAVKIDNCAAVTAEEP
mmetsp:Transcript_31984/g.52843  ORF Transcript_31984/g.52843 Transcript_31984/m.52843 type:complete len:205 (+) Transcript_31984:273-887(+)